MGPYGQGLNYVPVAALSDKGVSQAQPIILCERYGGKVRRWLLIEQDRISAYDIAEIIRRTD